MRFAAMCIFLACLGCALRAQTPTKAKSLYGADKQKVLAGDLDFDWFQFRLAAEQGGADNFDWHPARTQCLQRMRSGDYAAALASAEQMIGHNIAEPEGHLLAMMADNALHKSEDAAFQRRIVDAWVKSIERSGDGKTEETAFVVVNVDEEYFYLRAVLGMGLPGSQSLVRRNGHAFDLIKFKTSDGQDREVWFNTDISMDALQKALGSVK